MGEACEERICSSKTDAMRKMFARTRATKAAAPAPSFEHAVSVPGPGLAKVMIPTADDAKGSDVMEGGKQVES